MVKAKYEQGTVSEYDKISADVQMRSLKPTVVSARNGVNLANLQLKVLMGMESDVKVAVDYGEDSIFDVKKVQNHLCQECLVKLVPPISIKGIVDFDMVLDEMWAVAQEEMNFVNFLMLVEDVAVEVVEAVEVE